MKGLKSIYEELKGNYLFFLIVFIYFEFQFHILPSLLHDRMKYIIYASIVLVMIYSLLVLFYFLFVYLFNWHRTGIVEKILSETYQEDSDGNASLNKTIKLAIRRSDDICIELTEDWIMLSDSPVKGSLVKLIWFPFQKHGKMFHMSLVIQWILFFCLVFWVGRSVLCDDDLVRKLINQSWQDCIIC